MTVGGDVLPGPGARTLAAEFWTYWKLSRVLLGTGPNRTPLQYSNRGEMEEWMSFSATESVRDGRSRTLFLRFKS